MYGDQGTMDVRTLCLAPLSPQGHGSRRAILLTAVSAAALLVAGGAHAGGELTVNGTPQDTGYVWATPGNDSQSVQVNASGSITVSDGARIGAISGQTGTTLTLAGGAGTTSVSTISGGSLNIDMNTASALPLLINSGAINLGTGGMDIRATSGPVRLTVAGDLTTGGINLYSFGPTAVAALRMDNTDAARLVSGTIDAPQRGVLVVAGSNAASHTVTFTDAIGAAVNPDRIDRIYVGRTGMAAGHATFQNTVTANEIYVSTINGSGSTAIFYGNVTADSMGIDAASSAIFGTTSNALTALANSGTLQFTGTASNAGSLTNAGTLNLGSHQVTFTGPVTLNNGSMIASTIGVDAAGSGMLTSGDTITTANGGTVTFSPTVGAGTFFHNGDKVIVLTGGAPSVTTNTTFATTQSSGLLHWTARAGTAADGTDRFGTSIGTNQIILVASVDSASSVSGISPQAVPVLGALMRSNSSLAGTVQNLSSSSDLNTAGAQLAPTNTNSSTSQASQQAVTQINNVIDARTTQVRSIETQGTGISTGEVLKGLGVWGQTFGYLGDQDRQESVEGWRAQTAGLAVGADAKVAESLRLGSSLAFAGSTVTGKGDTSGNTNKIKSYQLSLYGTYSGAPWYVNGLASAALHRYETRREVTFPGFSDVATASHDGYQTTVKVDGGYPVPLPGNTVLTPVAGMSWSELRQQGYTEASGAGSALRVTSDTETSIRSMLGVRLGQGYSYDATHITPEIKASWLHEFNNEQIQTTSAFAAGGSSFTTVGLKPAADTAVLGVAVTVARNDLILMAGYDAELRQGYVGHSGILQVRSEF